MLLCVAGVKPGAGAVGFVNPAGNVVVKVAAMGASTGAFPDFFSNFTAGGCSYANIKEFIRVGGQFRWVAEAGSA